MFALPLLAVGAEAGGAAAGIGAAATAATAAGTAGAAGVAAGGSGIAGAGMAASAGGGLLSAIGSIFTGQSQSAMANYQAAVAKQQAQIAEQDAAYAREAGEVSAQEVGLRAGQQIGQTRAAYGAGNISLAGGSPSRVVSSEIAVAQQSQGLERANAAKRAYGFEVQAAGDTAQSGMYEATAHTAPIAAMFSAGSSILGSVGQVSSQYIQGRMAGIYSG